MKKIIVFAILPVLFLFMVIMMSTGSSKGVSGYNNSTCQYIAGHELSEELEEKKGYAEALLIDKELGNVAIGVYVVTKETDIRVVTKKLNDLTEQVRDEGIYASPSAYMQAYKFGFDYLMYLKVNRLENSLKVSKGYYEKKVTHTEDNKDDYKFFQEVLAVVSPNCSVGTDGMPVDLPIKIVSQNGERPLDGYHYGVDIAKSMGANIYAVADGTVVSVSKSCPVIGELGNKCGANGITGGGNFVVYEVETSKGKEYINCFHMEKIYVQKGDVITKGKNIGTVGSSGNSSGAHLHLEIHENVNVVASKEGLINPCDYIKGMCDVETD